MLSLTACNTNNLAEYKKALDKTEQITRGQTQVEFSSNVDINTEGMSAETIRELDYYKDMKGSFNVAFDEEAEKSIFRSYINFGGLKYVALVDIDGYIVSENIEFHIKAEDKSLIIREVDYKLNVKNWDINKEQVFDFPVLNDKNSIKADNAKEIPDVMKSLFDKE